MCPNASRTAREAAANFVVATIRDLMPMLTWSALLFFGAPTAECQTRWRIEKTLGLDVRLSDEQVLRARVARISNLADAGRLPADRGSRNTKHLIRQGG